MQVAAYCGQRLLGEGVGVSDRRRSRPASGRVQAAALYAQEVGM